MKKYTFKVANDANKIEIAKAVEELFGVKVAKGKHHERAAARSERDGHATAATQPDWKKAIVTLKEDSKGIEFFESMYANARSGTMHGITHTSR